MTVLADMEVADMSVGDRVEDVHNRGQGTIYSIVYEDALIAIKWDSGLIGSHFCPAYSYGHYIEYLGPGQPSVNITITPGKISISCSE